MGARMIRFVSGGLLAIFALLLIAFALSSASDRADLTYVNPYGIHTLDPARMSWTQDFRVALNLWEGLTTTDPRTGAPMAGAAELPPRVSADGLTYTFVIRRDARWCNGDPVTTADFLRGWRRAIEPGTAADYAFFFTDHVRGAREYVQWRADNVSLLTALCRLRDGWGVDSVGARTLSRAEICRELPGKWSDGCVSAPQESGAIDLGRWAASLGAAPIAWAALHRRVFDDHVRQLDERFASVGLRAVDERTLEMELTRPCPYLLDLASAPVFLPCHASIEDLRMRSGDAPLTAEGLVVYDPQWTKPEPQPNGYPGLVTNGPYRLVEWRFKRRLRMAVNPYYPDADAIACRSVDMLVVDNISASLLAYEAGQVEFLPALDVPYDHELARLAQSGARPDFLQCRTFATYFLNFNCASESLSGRENPLRDRRVRLALALAVDRRRLVEQVLRRGDRVARTFVPPDVIPGYLSPEGLSYEPDRARELLASAGFPGGAGLAPLELLYTPNDERLCQAVARMWQEELGVRLELRGQESKALAERKARQQFMIARGNWFADYLDPATFLDCLISGNGNNDSGYHSAEFDALMEEAHACADPNRRTQLLAAAERIIVEVDVPILPILHYASLIAVQPYVQGITPNPRLRFPFRYASLGR